VAQKTTAGTRGKRVRGRLIMIKVILVIKVINQRGKKRETRVLFFFQPLKGLDEIVVARGLNKKDGLH